MQADDHTERQHKYEYTANKLKDNMPKSIENTVFVRLVPPPTKVLRHELEELFSQMGPIKKSSWIHRDAAGSSNRKKKKEQEPQQHEGMGGEAPYSSKGYGFVKYVSSHDAEAATKELHDTTIQMNGQSIQLKVELASQTATVRTDKNLGDAAVDNDADRRDHTNASSKTKSKTDATIDEPAIVEEDDVASTTSLLSKMKASSRIIVRNLSFYAKEGHVRKCMESQFGKVMEIHIPYVKDKLHVGFCFVTFETANDAQKAIASKQVNIQKRLATMEWCVPKRVHQQQRKEQQQQEEDEVSGRQQDSSKDNVGNEEHEKPEIGGGGSSSSDDEDDSDGDSADDNVDDENNDVNRKDSDDSHDSQGNDAEDTGKPDDKSNSASPRPPDEVEEDGVEVDEKRTLFLRNLPFDATRHDLFQVFLKFGYIQGIYLVRDRETNVAKGTAFVTYSKPESAQKAIEKYSQSRGFVPQREANSQFSTTTATRDGSNSLILRGRPIMVDLAVDRETAATFDTKSDKATSTDRRNMYLQAESRVESSSAPGSSAANRGKLAAYGTWDDLPLQDQRKRQHALKDKTTKLQSPLFYINPRRLSFRNLAKHIDEASLRQLCVDATKRGLEKGLVTADDQIAHWRAPGELSTRDILSKIKKLETENEPVIPPFLKDRQTNETGGSTGALGSGTGSVKEYIPSVYIDRDFGKGAKKADAPSRGFGFVDFQHHAHALSCLRELNNNPGYSKDFAAGGAVASAMKQRRGRRNNSSFKASGSANGFVGDDGRVLVPRLIVDFTVENKAKSKRQAEHRLQQQANQMKQRLEKRKQLENEDEQPRKKKSRGALQRERKRLQRESGEDGKEETISSLSVAATGPRHGEKVKAEARIANKAKHNVKPMKPPKKKKKSDREDDRFDRILNSHLETYVEGSTNKDFREKVNKKRWFD